MAGDVRRAGELIERAVILTRGSDGAPLTELRSPPRTNHPTASPQARAIARIVKATIKPSPAGNVSAVEHAMRQREEWRAPSTTARCPSAARTVRASLGKSHDPALTHDEAWPRPQQFS